MEIQKEQCAIKYIKERSEILVSGSMRLLGAENYNEISDVFTQAVEDEPKTLTLDITKLRFLNSSGINVFFKFLISLRKRNKTQLTILGTNDFFWQKKTLQNFQKILPGTKLKI
ncbi:MAG: STAS domain-containing protein [Deltaproteobacteria bacterium]|nr:STAS domain-containing protein [Deltaproteobacteria bacterium]